MESLDRVETLISEPPSVCTPSEPSLNNNDLEEEEEEEEEECESDEEEDVDFNPFLKGSPSRDASSSLSSEVEAIDGEIVNSITEGKENEIAMQSNVSCEEPIPEDSNSDPASQKGGEFVREERTVEANENMIQTQKQVLMFNEEEDDAICKRTRAKYSLESFTLDDLEAFLQETDDEEDILNVDDEEEYRKFLAAVLQSGGDGEVQLEQSGNNEDDDDEDNDLDFEIELEEALETDDEEIIIPEKVREDDNNKSNKRRPVTRQKRQENISIQHKNTCSEQASRLLRPLVPILPVASSPKRLLPVTEAVVSSEESPINGFTQTQIGELHCLIHDHLQLLIQVYSLCALDHSRQHIGTQVQGLISQMLQQQQRRSHLPVTDSTSSVVGVVDLAGRYLTDVSKAVQDYRRSQLESGFDATPQRVPLFPLPHQEVSGNNPCSSSSSSKQQTKKTLAATLVESTKKQSVALVHKDIANLAKRFLPFFKISLYPHKAPPAAVANRTLFTDAEDELLALGIMEYNSDWKAIKQRFLPCKGEHQIYVRQKNRRSSKALENPIKAVLRMKSSPLTPQEIVRIQEGLKYFKYDWMSVWKYVVPYRDPSSLPRQWRTALGIQKSYKLDDVKKEKRRLYDNRRKSREQPASAKEDRNGASKESVDNSSEAYLHEGFLAELRPGMPSFFYSASTHSDVSRDRHESVQTCTTTTGEASKSHGTQRLVSPSSLIPLYQNHTTGTPTSRAPVTMLPYRSRKLYNKSVVRLAPDLPLVNLPDSVRVISQSVFAKNQSETSSKTCLVKSVVSDASVRENLGTETETPCVSADRDNNEKVVDLEEDDDVPAESSSRNNDSVLEMHPLLFRTPEHHGQITNRDTGGSSSSFSFFSDNRPQLLSLFNSPRPINHSENEDEAALDGFHPLLQRTEYETSYHRNSRRGKLSKKGKSCQLQDASDAVDKTSVSGSSKHGKDVNLNIYLSSSASKVKDTGNVSAANTSEVPGMNQRNDGSEVAGSSDDVIRIIEEMGDQSNPGIVMEQEELSDSDEEMMEEEEDEDDDEEEDEHVEFECEEMADSEGEEECEEIIEMQDKDTRSSTVETASTYVDSGKELGKDSPNSPWLSLDPSSSKVKEIEKTKLTLAQYGTSSRSRRKRTLMKNRDTESKEDAGLRLGPVESKKPKKCLVQAETSTSIETS